MTAPKVSFRSEVTRVPVLWVQRRPRGSLTPGPARVQGIVGVPQI